MTENPILTISEGKIQGTTLCSVLGINYLAFKGIPFAQIPIGPLRFKPPQPPLEWSGIRDASKHAGDMALQNSTDTKDPVISGSEDCLYLNVYTKPIGNKRPVMVFIHGGSFVEGSGNDCIYREDYLVTLDIVLVCVNYRLGPLGFLNLGIEEAPGNQGLRDIIFALKWIQKNIEAFGGDSNNVTIFGHSAGSIICHLLTLIPAAKGLFHKAILQSGTVTLVKALMNQEEFRNGFLVASHLGFNSDDPVKVVEFLRSVPPEKLIALEGSILPQYDKDILYLQEYAIVYDANYAEDPVIPAPINELLKNDADIPIIVGNTPDEACLLFQGRYNDATYEFYNKYLDDLIENILRIKDTEKSPDIVKYIKEFYLKNRPIDKDTVRNFITLVSDLFLNHTNRKIVDLRNEHAHAPTYFYNFSYTGNEMTIYQYDKGPQPLKGVAHGDELSYMFYLAYIKKNENANNFPQEGTKDRIVMERLLRMWYNFAATGNPTPEVDDKYITTIWKPTSKEAIYYLDIDEDLTLRNDKESERRVTYEPFKESF